MNLSYTHIDPLRSHYRHPLRNLVCDRRFPIGFGFIISMRRSRAEPRREASDGYGLGTQERFSHTMTVMSLTMPNVCEVYGEMGYASARVREDVEL